MGYSVTWFAVPAQQGESFLARLALSATGETEEFPESQIVTATLDTGWLVLWYNSYDCPFLGDRELRELSKSFEIIHCLIEEHVMASSAELWSRGGRTWLISHRGDVRPMERHHEGLLPDCFSSIKAEMEAAQAAEDAEECEVDHLFEIPLKVAQTITGFKHDEACPRLPNKVFHVMQHAAPQRSLFDRLFGRG